MNTCKEMPYEELNSMQVSASESFGFSLGFSHTFALIISLEFHRSTGKELLYERRLF